MKIVDVSGFYSDTGGGVRSYVLQKLERAAQAGHELTVIAPGSASRVEAKGGGKIVWVAAPVMPFDANYRVFRKAQTAAVWRVLDAELPDVVEGSSPWRGGYIAGTWPGGAVKALVYHQDFVAGYPYTYLGRLMSRQTIDSLFTPFWDYVVRLSQRYDVTVTGGDWLARRLAGFGVHNPVAVPFGIEPGHFTPAMRDETLRRDLLARCGLGPEAKLLLTVGRFHPEKQHRTIIEGFAMARAARDDLGLVVIGDGMTRPTVERLAAKAGRVYLHGAVSDRDALAKIYASGDALVHGSGAETYGLVVAEALSSGLPVVAPDSGGAADLADQGPSVLYSTGDAKACAAAILDLLSRNAADWPPVRVGSAREHFENLFSLYETLLRQKKSVDNVSSGQGQPSLPEGPRA